MAGHEERRAARAEMLTLVARLVAEYAAVLPAGTVIRCAARVHESLLRAGVRDDLPARTERLVREELRHLLPAHVPAAVG